MDRDRPTSSTPLGLAPARIRIIADFWASPRGRGQDSAESVHVLQVELLAVEQDAAEYRARRLPDEIVAQWAAAAPTSAPGFECSTNGGIQPGVALLLHETAVLRLNLSRRGPGSTFSGKHFQPHRVERNPGERIARPRPEGSHEGAPYPRAPAKRCWQALRNPGPDLFVLDFLEPRAPANRAPEPVVKRPRNPGRTRKGAAPRPPLLPDDGADRADSPPDTARGGPHPVLAGLPGRRTPPGATPATELRTTRDPRSDNRQSSTGEPSPSRAGATGRTGPLPRGPLIQRGGIFGDYEHAPPPRSRRSGTSACCSRLAPRERAQDRRPNEAGRHPAHSVHQVRAACGRTLVARATIPPRTALRALSVGGRRRRLRR